MGDNTLEVVLRLKDQLSGELKRASSAMGSSMNSIAENGKKAGDALQDIGAGMVTIGAAPMAALIGATTASNNFEEQLADVRKTTGLTGDELEKMKDQILDMSGGTRTSIDDLMEIARVAGQLGVEDVPTFTTAIDKLNVALGDEFSGGAEEITTKMGKIQKMFKETKDMKLDEGLLSIGSAVNYLGSAGAATGPSIADFTNRIGQLPENIRPGINEVMTLGAVFEEAALTAEISSGGFTNFMLVANKNLDAFAGQMGVTTEAARELINTNPAEFAFTFAESLKGLDSVETAKVMDDLKIGTQESIKVVGALQSSQERYTELLKGTNQEFKNATSVLDEYDIKNNTTAANIDKMKNRFKTLAIEVGDNLKVKLEQLYQTFEPLIDSTLRWVENNQGLVANLIIVGAVIGALGIALITIGIVISTISTAIGGFMTIWGLLVPLFTTIGTFITATLLPAIGSLFTFITATAIPAIGAFIVAFWPVILVVAAVGAAIAGLYYIWSNNMFGIQEKTRAVWSFVSNFIRENWSRIAWIGGPIAGFVALIIDNWSWLSSATSSTWNTITSTITGAIEGVKSGFSGLVSSVTNTLGNLWNKVQDYANKIKDAMNKISPFHKSSPSLVEYVQMGSSEIINAYENLGSKIQGMDFGRDNAIAGITPQPALATARGAAQPTTNTDNRVVNINLGGVTVRSQSDIDNLVTQLSFVMKTDSSI